MTTINNPLDSTISMLIAVSVPLLSLGVGLLMSVPPTALGPYTAAAWAWAIGAATGLWVVPWLKPAVKLS
jgi:hypothetical protein